MHTIDQFGELRFRLCDTDGLVHKISRTSLVIKTVPVSVEGAYLIAERVLTERGSFAETAFGLGHFTGRRPTTMHRVTRR
jgi:hypothetical protein